VEKEESLGKLTSKLVSSREKKTDPAPTGDYKILETKQIGFTTGGKEGAARRKKRGESC